MRLLSPGIITLVGFTLLWACVPGAQAADLTCGTPYPDPTPYPELTPPPSTGESLVIPIPIGSVVYVSNGEELQAAFNIAAWGDRIIVTQDIEWTLTVAQNRSGIWIEGVGPERIKWTGAAASPAVASGAGQPAYTGAGAIGMRTYLKGFDLAASKGYSLGSAGTEGKDGVAGRTAIFAPIAGSLVLIDCSVAGGDGGDGEAKATCPGSSNSSSGDGGAGGACWSGSNTQVYADLNCSFRGGDGGAAPDPVQLTCCINGGVPGVPAPPTAPTKWVNYVYATTTPSPTPTATRTPSPSPTPSPSATASPTPTPSTTSTPEPTPICGTPHPAATPYADVTPPASTIDSYSPPAPIGTVRTVTTGPEFQAAFNASASGDRIILTQDIEWTLTVDSRGGVWIEAPQSGRVKWTGAPADAVEGAPGHPAYLGTGQIFSVGRNIIKGIDISGSSGFSFGELGTGGRNGGPGANAIEPQSFSFGAPVLLIDCVVTGGAGGDGEPSDACDGKAGDGGAGGRNIGGGAQVNADLSTVFKGGPGGAAPPPVDLGCCVGGGVPGAPGAPNTPSKWVNVTIVTPTGTPTPVPTPGPFEDAGARAVGDFDSSGCTDLTDFLLLLDDWQLFFGGATVGLQDFLALLDNWQTGAGCV